jgi:hypothetical protein
MTKEQALHSFWSSFGLTAYEENSVPSGENKPDLPYITYSVSTDSFGNDVALNANLWYRGTSWSAVNDKVAEISAAISSGGKLLDCDNGCIWVKRGTPFAQNVPDPMDDLIKRKYINITVEFLTAD